ncbi:MAG: ShlB/FhaC/HecB family hemolysin secretion/activation protein [Deltaproteobacteria bacterium]|nr:ShlB/FhaC/HecB family hemolysin secretion/activation protein [Deltaproteobacteria bacterium]
MSKTFKRLFVFSLFVLMPCMQIWAEAPEDEPPDGGFIERSLTRVEVPVEIMMMLEIEDQKPKPVLPEEKVFIKEVNVIGVTLLSEREITDITAEFTDRELTGKQMQRCADQISDVYSIKGYITSYVYIEPDALTQGVLRIQAVEGKVGEIKIEGNQHFSDKVYLDRLDLKPGDVFNYKLLTNNVYRTNRHMDRKVSIKVEPTYTLEYTNITVSVKDKLPLHFVFDHDNYGSQFIQQKRFKQYAISNNITGHDDYLSLHWQFGQADAHRLFDFDYRLPLNNTWMWQLYYMPHKTEDYYDQNREKMNFKKRATKWYTYFYQTFYDEPEGMFQLNYGFVYKYIDWYAWGSKQKKDRFCALLFGLNWVRHDDYGTWAIRNDMEQGIPDIWGASHKEDSSCSVKGAGSGYFRNKIYIARRQKLIWDADFLLKLQGQYSDQATTGVNVFSVGGLMGTIDNRGYPRAQMPKDSGWYYMLALRFPLYLLPKNAKIPHIDDNVYKNLRLFVFYEYGKGYKRSTKTVLEKLGFVPLKSTKTDDVERDSLRSAGCGFTWNLPKHNLSMRFDAGWPLDHKLPMDGDHFHAWYRVTKTF